MAASAPHARSCLTFIVVPNADAPDAAQTPLRGNLEHVEAVAVEGVFSIQMSVTTFIVHAIQGDPYVGCGTWQSSEGSVRAVHPSWSCSPALPSCQM